MNVDRSLVMVDAGMAGEPNMVAAAQRLLKAQYHFVLVGEGATQMAAAWEACGVPAQPLEDIFFGAAAGSLLPAIAIALPGVDIPESVPNRLCWSPGAKSRYTEGVEQVNDVAAWARDYLAPRVPRHFSEQTKP